MKLSDIHPRAWKQVTDAILAIKVKEAPLELEAARSMCDAAEAPKLEKQLQRLCELELSRWGVEFLHLSPKAREKKGWPDLAFPHPHTGIFCGIELKTARGVVSGDQKRTLASMRYHGAFAVVVRDYGTFRRIFGCYNIESLMALRNELEAL
jgi:hypothetical protein